jgi:hypothetical protein
VFGIGSRIVIHCLFCRDYVNSNWTSEAEPR